MRRNGRMRMEEVLLSVIIPVYQVEKYIDSCLMSIIDSSKNVRGIEILLLDDGSRDGSAFICKKYEKEYPWIHYFYSENKGVSSTRNKGISIAKGQYLTFLDADDFMSNSFLDVAIKEIGLNDFELCVFEYEDFLEENGTSLGMKRKSNRYKLFEKSQVPIDGLLFLERMFTSSTRVASVWGSIYRKDFLINNLISFNEEMNSSEDFDFIVNCMIHARKVQYVNCISVYYRRERIGSATQRYNAFKLMCDLKMREKWYRYFLNETITGKTFFANDFVYFLSKYSAIISQDNQLLNYVKDNKDVIGGGSSKKSKIFNYLIKFFGLRVSLKVLGVIGEK